jgi:hypothetical protein
MSSFGTNFDPTSLPSNNFPEARDGLRGLTARDHPHRSFINTLNTMSSTLNTTQKQIYASIPQYINAVTNTSIVQHTHTSTQS